MADTGQKKTPETHFFDFVERNLPKQETDDIIEELSVREFILWMMGIAGAVFIIQYFSRLLF